MLKFDGLISYTIPGFHGEVVGDSPEVPTSNKYLWGLRGNVLIIGRRAKRNLSCELWLSDPSWETPEAFYSGLATLEDTIGEHGTLNVIDDALHGVWATAAQQTFDNCYFAGFEPMSFDGQAFPSPVQDEAACLYAQSIVPDERDNKSWAMRMRLNWIQTVPDRVVVP